MKKIFKEFVEFISRGNAIEMAVGVVIGSAFTSIVNSIVKDVLGPVNGFLMGGVNLTHFKIVLKEATEEVAEVAITYGNVIQNLINFIMTAIVLFFIIKGANSLHRMREKLKKAEETQASETEPAPAEPSEEILLLREIRDALKKNENG